MAVTHDIRYAAQAMRRAPGFTAVVILSLALGIGATTAVFTVVNAVLLRQIPATNPDQLVELLSLYPRDPRMNFWGQPVLDHFRANTTTLSALAGTCPTREQLTVEGGSAEAVDGERVTPDFFATLGLEPAIGRLLGPSDARARGVAPDVAVLSWAYWHSRFGGDRAIVGRQIVVNGAPATIVGVAPRGFTGLFVGRPAWLWLPIDPDSPVQAVGRLKPGASMETAQAEFRVLDRFRTEPMAQRDPQWRKATLEISSAATGFAWLRDQFGTQLQLLMIVVAALLVIACTNVATLMAARATARQRELAVRASLGASGSRLVRQLLVESLLLAVPGGLLGLAFARAGATALVGAWPVDSRARIEHLDVGLRIDADVALFTLAITLATALIVGLAPAWSALPTSTTELLRGERATTSRWGRRFAGSLVIAQLTVSIVMLSSALLLAAHVWTLRSENLGFDHRDVLIINVEPPRGADRASLFQQYRAMAERFGAIPGVRSAAFAATTPIQPGGASRFVQVEGVQDDPASRRRVSLNWVGPAYFETLRTPILAGREFAQTDDGDRRVAIVNRGLAEQYFGHGDGLGRRFTLEGGPAEYEIVGVVADAKYSNIHEPAPPTIYLNALQDARGSVSQFVLRLDTAEAPVIAEARRTVQEIAPATTVSKTRMLADQLDAAIIPERLLANLSSTLAACGAVLAAIGLYGLLAHAVAARRREIGIRMALGATRSDIARMVVWRALALVTIGLALSLPLALWSERIAGALIVNMTAGITMPALAAGAIMLLIAVVAASLPARRASRVQPAEALRAE